MCTWRVERIRRGNGAKRRERNELKGSEARIKRDARFIPEPRIYLLICNTYIQRGRCCRNKNGNIFNNPRKTFDHFGNLINVMYRNI